MREAFFMPSTRLNAQEACACRCPAQHLCGSLPLGHFLDQEPSLDTNLRKRKQLDTTTHNKDDQRADTGRVSGIVSGKVSGIVSGKVWTAHGLECSKPWRPRMGPKTWLWPFLRELQPQPFYNFPELAFYNFPELGPSGRAKSALLGGGGRGVGRG